MVGGTVEDQLTLQNNGIPWDPQKAAEALGVLPASAKRTLTALERRKLICCWGTGTGRGRRISHVKMSAQADQIATWQLGSGMSEAQFARRVAHLKVSNPEALIRKRGGLYRIKLSEGEIPT
jgi:predicted ArsR family transcriptional regulator